MSAVGVTSAAAGPVEVGPVQSAAPEASQDVAFVLAQASAVEPPSDTLAGSAVSVTVGVRLTVASSIPTCPTLSVHVSV